MKIKYIIFTISIIICTFLVGCSTDNRVAFNNNSIENSNEFNEISSETESVNDEVDTEENVVVESESVTEKSPNIYGFYYPINESQHVVKILVGERSSYFAVDEDTATIIENHNFGDDEKCIDCGYINTTKEEYINKIKNKYSISD